MKFNGSAHSCEDNAYWTEGETLSEGKFVLATCLTARNFSCCLFIDVDYPTQHRSHTSSFPRVFLITLCLCFSAVIYNLVPLWGFERLAT